MDARLDTYEDDALLKLIGEDNELAFQALYIRYSEMLLRYIYNHVQSRETAKEVLQDTFLKLWHYRHTLEITHSLKSYLFTGARNNMLLHIRQEKKRKAYAADMTLFLLNEHDNSNAAQQNLNDIRSIIEKELTLMPEKWRMAFRLSRQQHLPIKEVAETMGIEAKTAHNYLTQALSRLRLSLGEFMVLVVAVLVG